MESASGKNTHEKESPPLPCEDWEPETSKIYSWDTPTTDPGHVEVDLSYSLIYSGKEWGTNAHRYNRNLLRIHQFDSLTLIGITKSVDVIIGQGYAFMKDKANNYNEVAGILDPDTKEEMEDETIGPHRGHGLTDLTAGARWQFYNNTGRKLSLAYIPMVQIPTGRRHNLDHLGPSQGYVSMDNRLALTKNWKKISLSANLAYSVPFAHLKRTENYCGTFETTLSAGYQLNKWLQPQIEAVYNHVFEKQGKGAKLCTMVFGFVAPLNDHVRFDIGLIQDIYGSGADQTSTGCFKIVLMT